MYDHEGFVHCYFPQLEEYFKDNIHFGQEVLNYPPNYFTIAGLTQDRSQVSPKVIVRLPEQRKLIPAIREKELGLTEKHKGIENIVREILQECFDETAVDLRNDPLITQSHGRRWESLPSVMLLRTRIGEIRKRTYNSGKKREREVVHFEFLSTSPIPDQYPLFAEVTRGDFREYLSPRTQEQNFDKIVKKYRERHEGASVIIALGPNRNQKGDDPYAQFRRVYGFSFDVMDLWEKLHEVTQEVLNKIE